MQFIPQEIPEVVLVVPKVFGDDRGFFMETWRADIFDGAGIAHGFVQDNHSSSGRGVLRGLHYQIEQVQGKLVRAIAGEIFDVAVDIRRGSPSFGHWVGTRLSADNKHQLWVPPGFAHGFLVLSGQAEVLYRCTDYYAPSHERCILWNDPQLAIEWPLNGIDKPKLSERDARAPLFAEAAVFEGMSAMHRTHQSHGATG